jgi:AraC family transcriptional regulator, positive regulator of tynA and feaB
METYRTSDLPVRTRIAAWSELYSSQLDQADLTPVGVERFNAELRLGEFGPLRIARLLCSDSSIHRTNAHVSMGSQRSYMFALQVSGRSELAQYGQAAQLHAGDLTLCDNAAPYTHSLCERSELILLRVPAQILRQHMPCPENFCGRRLAASDCMTPIVSSLMTNLNSRIGAGLPAAVQERLAHQLLELIATSYTLAFDALIVPTSMQGNRLAKARQIIEQQLQNLDLSPGLIARSMQMSTRYLRMIFAGADEPVSSYILRRRLEESARQLADARWRGRSICEIAFGWGFNSASHFSRSFRDRYGMSPRQYRARQAGQNGHSTA